MSVKFLGVGGPGQIGSLKPTEKSQGTKATKEGAADSVQFSSVLQDVHKAQSMKGSNSSERAERVLELKAQVTEGSYQPDLQKVATSLLQFIIEEK